MIEQPRFPQREAVDFVIIGSGSAGGILARELSVQGFKVVVLEQGRYRRTHEFTHDELSVMFNHEYVGGPLGGDPQTFRHDASEKAEVPDFPPAYYARMVGGSSVHFSANFWRLRPVDFKERSLLGAIDNADLADWPLDYDELEPYYTRVDWEIGVSGAPGPFDPPRSRPYPLPPMSVKSSGVLLEKGARELGLHPQVAPVAILSQPFNGRAPCIHCGFCMGFGCETGAKSSTLVTMIPQAEATGRCEIRSQCTVHRIETDARGRASEVLYYDAAGQEQGQRARVVIVAANGAETPRLLLMSASERFPDGLANGSGLVGRNLMFNAHSATYAWFDQPLHDYKSVQCSRIVHDFYDSDPKRGFYGGGAIDARPFLSASPMLYALTGMPPDTPRWGAGFKRDLAYGFTRSMMLAASTTSLAMDRNNITLDPELKDRFGRPAMRVTYNDHPHDLAMATFLQDWAERILDAAGAEKTWRKPVEPETVGAHLLGTCRMGDDPQRAVVDRYHRSHDVPNLFICDGSSMVTSGRGQPTMTIMALAFRAAHHIGEFARRGEI
ncbi:GMC family oxidoreductase [Thioalkalivibrio sp. XN279]|uniref:GMC family oxidoreductase n=1 Tax=Thioalkalivibrio sp. XN279 TaxID=2714953 RepID=UPI0014097AF3|nr:GMC family oxidoreductase [Thioalkalivibrio sp. XN279]NHA15938.1 GMC family oxidoreductase [Thioalkalivibrio sp. XN279]